MIIIHIHTIVTITDGNKKTITFSRLEPQTEQDHTDVLLALQTLKANEPQFVYDATLRVNRGAGMYQLLRQFIPHSRLRLNVLDPQIIKE